MDKFIDFIIGFVIFGMLICIVGFAYNWITADSKGIEDEYGVTEWVSPDGVHYWMYQGFYRAAIAPRYDHEGNLVID